MDNKYIAACMNMSDILTIGNAHRDGIDLFPLISLRSLKSPTLVPLVRPTRSRIVFAVAARESSKSDFTASKSGLDNLEFELSAMLLNMHVNKETDAGPIIVGHRVGALAEVR
jgi:hypothetical protein